jgi:hypothetical protein
LKRKAREGERRYKGEINLQIASALCLPRFEPAI